MERVIKRRDEFTLWQTALGFVWVMEGQGGPRWYWHPNTLQWTQNPRGSPTESEAGVGLGPDGPKPEG